eukprot:COSAG06_NODE_200_length_20386_cov_35.829547_5_plen_749_part_00
MVTPTGQPGVNPEKDVSVPINWAYNHHYCAYMQGKHAERKEIPTPGDVYGSGAHGMKTIMASVDKADQSGKAHPNIQNKWFISEGNGGESRKSFHGYPAGFAQLIESPTSWHITPMQIDTRNRKHGVKPADVHRCTNFSGSENGEPCASYEPRQARYGRNWAGVDKSPADPGHYSGVLECPCNSRYGGDPEFYPTQKTKKLTASFTAIVSGNCEQGMDFKKAQGCYDAIAQLGFNTSKITNVTKSDPSSPAGCVLVQSADGSAEALYNTGGSGACKTSSVVAGESTSKANKVTLGVSLDSGSKLATITLSGPSTGWFAAGLNAELMVDQPYTIVANSSGVHERKLGTCGTEADHCAGTPIASTLTLLSNTVSDGVRTVVMTRNFTGATKDHYTFDPTKVATMNYISASNSASQAFTFHTAKDQMKLTFASSNPTCVCDLGETGELCWNPAVVNGSGAWGSPASGQGCANFKKSCVARTAEMGKAGTTPSGDLLNQRNPTCNSGQYSGGLSCCKHGRIMLDADQEIQMEEEHVLRYHMKFRFWYQEYNATGPPVSKGVAALTNASHVDLPRIYWTTEANAGEYDIPPAFYKPGEKKIVGYPEVGPYPELTPGSSCTGNCPDGPDCECEHTITYNNTVSNMRLIYAGGHCHAPACKGIWLHRNDPGHEMELLCHQAPIYGNGTGVSSKAGIYDEKGYLALPPCLWGDEPGLHPSILLPPNTPLVSIKKNVNTHSGHFGEMASWQMRGISF